MIYYTDKKVTFEKSERQFKKYKATLPDGRIVHFGDKRYQQCKDITPLKLYANLSHNDEKIRELYYKRHAKQCPRYIADYFNNNYLWLYIYMYIYIYIYY